MITAETITDEEIRELRDTARQSGDFETAQCCTNAEHHSSRLVRRGSRARCAEIINARAASVVVPAEPEWSPYARRSA